MIRQFKVGEQKTYERVITQEEVDQFAKLTGDYNKAHFDEEYCSKTIFKKTDCSWNACGFIVL